MSTPEPPGLIRRRTVLGGLGASALALPSAGCASSEATRAGEGTTVRLTHGNLSVPLIRGEFEETLNSRGIDVDWQGPFPNHAPTLQAVSTDTADFSFGGSSTPANEAILSGADLVYIAWQVSTPRPTAILVKRGSGIDSVEDLAGRSVAVNKAGLGEFILVAALEKYGVDRGDVKSVYMNPPEASAAFASGNIDAWSVWGGYRESAEADYDAVPIFVEEEEIEVPIDFESYLVRRQYAEDHPDVIREVIAAFQAENEWANANYRESLEIGNDVSEYSEEVIDLMAEKNIQSELKLMDEEGIEALQYGADWLAERDIISDSIDISEHSVIIEP